MAEEEKPIAFSIKMKEVKLIDFTLTSRVKELKEPLKDEQFDFQMNVGTRLNDKLKMFEVQMAVSIQEIQNATTKIELANITTYISIEIVNFDEVIKKVDDNILSFPDQIFLTAVGITISTTRGMITVCVKDSPISNATLPLLSPSIFLPQAPTPEINVTQEKREKGY